MVGPGYLYGSQGPLFFNAALTRPSCVARLKASTFFVTDSGLSPLAAK